MRHLTRPEGEIKLLFNIIEEEADRLNRIVGDLLDFGRPAVPSLQPEAIGRVLEDAAEAALADNPHTIELEREIDPALPLVPVDAPLLKQALLNITMNAVQAMQGGGKLKLRAHQDGNAVLVEVGDTGPGIPEEIRERIFEPFFTTKASGTGLGLAVVKRIVEGHRAEVSVSSENGAGTTFAIRLPLVEPQHTAQSLF